MPFDIRRIFFISDVPHGQARGGHAHRRLHQVLIALTGHFDVVIDDGIGCVVYHLHSPTTGLYIPPMQWASQVNFEPGTVCLVLASDHFDDRDHIRDHREYLSALGQ